MPTFPRAASLIASPSQVWSYGAAVSANAPIISAEYPRTLLVDGSVAEACRFAFGTVQITIDLGTTRTPNLVGILNSNIDTGRVVGVTNEAGLARGFGGRDPNCWLDLRAFPTTARYWTFAINSNSVPLALSEIVIATATVFVDGLFEDGFTENLSYPGYREQTEYLKNYISASGALARSTEVRIRAAGSDRAALDAVFAEVGVSGGRVLLVPSTRLNDIWFMEWPSSSASTFQNPHERGYGLTLPEQVGSVLNRV